jgi:hypothetical protein
MLVASHTGPIAISVFGVTTFEADPFLDEKCGLRCNLPYNLSRLYHGCFSTIKIAHASQFSRGDLMQDLSREVSRNSQLHASPENRLQQKHALQSAVVTTCALLTLGANRLKMLDSSE